MPNTFPSTKVLHIDSDTTVGKTLTAILRIYHYNAVHVYTAAEALVWCRLQWPDVVIVDLTADPTESIQLAALIVSNHPDCKVLLLADNETASKVVKETIMTYYEFPIISKPVDRQKILDFLAKV